MTPRFYCSEPADEFQHEQERKPLKVEMDEEEQAFWSAFSGRKEESPFGSDPIGECDLFWYPELR